MADVLGCFHTDSDTKGWYRIMFDLTGEIAAVFGGTGALGGAMAQGLAEAGARVAVLGRSEERGAHRVSTIQSAGGQACFLSCNALEHDSVAAAHDEVRRRYGAASVLVNATGGNEPGVTVTAELPFEDIELEAWRRNFDLNIAAGVLLPCQEFGPAMVAEGIGSIINIASVSSYEPLSRVVAYSAAKAGVLSITKFLAREWGESGVRVNAIVPGFFPGEQNRRLLFNEDGTPTARGEEIMQRTPMSRFGNPGELVGAAVFLSCKKASGFVTGSDIKVDGGFLATSI